ncbi:MAG: nitroreductase [Saprospiraceae bacterium]|nr:nitroreductase [Saprospiraceae bacterium]
MNKNFEILSLIIRERRAIYPQFFEKGQIEDQLIYSILENGRWAPTHKKTQPWRFKIFKEDELGRLSEFLGQYYKETTLSSEFSEMKMKKAGEKAIQSAIVIGLCIERSPETVIPAWEETAAVACAVQNIWLSCTSLGIGSYWSSPSAIKKLPEYFGFHEGIECMGLFYMGWMKKDYQGEGVRKSLEEILL